MKGRDMKKNSRTIIIIFALMIVVGALLVGVGVSRSISSGEMASAKDAVLSFLKDNRILTEGSEGSIMIRAGEKNIIFSKDGSVKVLDKDTGVLPDEFIEDKSNDKAYPKSLLPDEKNDDGTTGDSDDKTEDRTKDKDSIPGEEPDIDADRPDYLENDDSYDFI